MFLESSVIAIVGRRGSGKSSLLTNIAVIDENEGKKIVANYHLAIPHIYMSFEDIVLLPEELQDATLLLDEFQVGAGARNALRNSNKTLNQFITQLRKRNIILYYGTQNFKFMDIDVRNQTDYILTTEKVTYNDDDDNRFKVFVVDRNDHTDTAFGSVINKFEWDATDLFKEEVFDTNEIINFGKE